MDRRTCLSYLGLGGLALAGWPALAQAGFEVGRDFELVQPPQPSEKGKVEVLEFFSYACPHCHELEPMLHKWAAKLPADVVLRRVPVTFNRPEWSVLARLYLTIEALGQGDRLHGAAFDAVHKKRLALHKEGVAQEWLAQNGIDAAKVGETWRSFAVAGGMQRLQQLATAYRVDGVPLLVVAGRYKTSASLTGDYLRMFEVVNDLIVRARREPR